jgi:hypothetical protein
MANKSSGDLKAYLSNNMCQQNQQQSNIFYAESCSNSSSDTSSNNSNDTNDISNITKITPPCVLIIDNLQQIRNLNETFGEYFGARSNVKQQQQLKKCDYIIGLMNCSSIASYALHRNLKWILCLNHTDPLKNFLSRYLYRRFVHHRTRVHQTSASSSLSVENETLESIVTWIPKLWLQINKHIEFYNSTEFTLAPKYYKQMPMDAKAALVWFAKLWNEFLVPYISETIKDRIEVFSIFV